MDGGSADEGVGHAQERDAWNHERAQLLARLAAETSRAAALAQQLQDRAAVAESLTEPVSLRDPGSRLLAREAERHAAEVALLQEAERSALARVEELTRQVRELRAELHEVQSRHATERMHEELELARWKAEAAGLRAAARRRAELLRPTPEELEARRAQRAADSALLAASRAAQPSGAEPSVAVPPVAEPPVAEPPGAEPPGAEEPAPVIVPPEWSAPEAAGPADPADPAAGEPDASPEPIPAQHDEPADDHPAHDDAARDDAAHDDPEDGHPEDGDQAPARRRALFRRR